MRLVIKHNLRETGTAGQESYEATYYLSEPNLVGFAPPQLEERLARQTLSQLARRWYLLNNAAHAPDANEALLADQPEADTQLGALIPKQGTTFVFTSNDPILVAALDERVRRAVAMILEDAVYFHYFTDKREQNFELGSEEHRPSGSAVPPVPKELRGKVTKSQ